MSPPAKTDSAQREGDTLLRASSPPAAWAPTPEKARRERNTDCSERKGQFVMIAGSHPPRRCNSCGLGCTPHSDLKIRKRKKIQCSENQIDFPGEMDKPSIREAYFNTPLSDTGAGAHDRKPDAGRGVTRPGLMARVQPLTLAFTRKASESRLVLGHKEISGDFQIY